MFAVITLILIVYIFVNVLKVKLMFYLLWCSLGWRYCHYENKNKKMVLVMEYVQFIQELLSLLRQYLYLPR